MKQQPLRTRSNESVVMLCTFYRTQRFKTLPSSILYEGVVNASATDDDHGNKLMKEQIQDG